MKTHPRDNRRTQQAYSLLTVMIITGVSLTIFAGAAKWTATTSLLNDRNNTYNSAVAAAEGASETVLSQLAHDFANQSFNPANVSAYGSLIPTEPWAAAYEFSDGAGGSNQTWVSTTPTQVLTNLDSQFSGLYGLVYACSIKSCATPLNTPYRMTAAVEQDVQLASIPVFQFAIFYAMDLEINPGPAMKVTGKVHSNANIYAAPVSGLEFVDNVTAVGTNYNNRAPGDPTGGGKVAPVYDAERLDKVSSLTLPIGANNSPQAVRAILQVPPFGENPASQTGQARYYNKTDLVVTATDTNVLVQAGNWNNFIVLPTDVAATSNSPAQYSFVKTNASFYDQREGKYTLTTDLDVAALGRWMTNAGASLNTLAQTTLGHPVSSVFINDQRAIAGKLTVARVLNGRQLPPGGLTVATPLPLYVQGQFNATNTTAGYTNTSGTLPASLAGDAITVLSGNWADTNSSKAMSQRLAVDTTVNAAFLGGIVQTTNAAGGHYSGGVENFPRFLETWSGKTLTYNGFDGRHVPQPIRHQLLGQPGHLLQRSHPPMGFRCQLPGLSSPAARHAAGTQAGSRAVEHRRGQLEPVPPGGLGSAHDGTGSPAGPSAMRILLRHLETGAYLKNARSWTDDREAAQDLVDHELAIRLARELRLRQAELVLVFGKPEFDIRLPLRLDPGYRPGLPG